LAKWFGSSGIRGNFELVSPKFAFDLGCAVGHFDFLSSNNTFIASDIRLTSDILKSSFISGYNSMGKNIIDIGKVPTPVISFISKMYETMGVMITASHNPPQNNGFKFFMNGGEGDLLFEEKIESYLQSILEIGKYNLNKTWDSVGVNNSQSSDKYLSNYLDYLLKSVKIKQKPQKICVDCANNVPSLVTPKIFQLIGIENVITLNEKLDGLFPGRPSEPTDDNLSTLKETVVNEGADMGIGQDGDGDRFAIIDENGEFISSTSMISFFVDHLDFSNPNRRKVILTVDCTSDAVDTARRHGGEVISSRIGRNRDYVHDKSVLFLGEPNKLIFPTFGKWIDGIYPTLKLISEVGKKSLSLLITPYNKRKVLRKAFNIDPDDKKELWEHINRLPEFWSSKTNQISTIDGLKLFLKNESSILLRFSGTEPKLKVYIESNSDNKNREILKKISAELQLEVEGIDC